MRGRVERLIKGKIKIAYMALLMSIIVIGFTGKEAKAVIVPDTDSDKSKIISVLKEDPDAYDLWVDGVAGSTADPVYQDLNDEDNKYYSYVVGQQIYIIATESKSDILDDIKISSEEDEEEAETAKKNKKTDKKTQDAKKEAEDGTKKISEGLNLEADTESATTMFTGFVPMINYFLGILVVLITIGMAIFTGLDISYIAFPVFRNKVDEQRHSGTGTFGTGKQTSSGEDKARFISDDVIYAVNTAQTSETGKSAYVIYLKQRGIAYCVLGVVLYIFLTGKITIFTNLAIGAVQGILGIISEVA